MNRFVLRVPDELYEKIRAQAAQQGVSINQYLLYTITRTVSAQETRTFFAERVSGGDPERALALLDTVAEREPEARGDRMPRRAARAGRSAARGSGHGKRRRNGTAH
jgi:hypothetical protein